LIENTSSIAIRNGLSMSRTGSGMSSPAPSISSSIDFSHFGSPLSAGSAAPRMIGALSPSNLYLFSSSRTSISTRSSISGSSTASHLFSEDHDVRSDRPGAPAARARASAASPLSSALTTRIAPSICAAPVIMFLM
jgi:hypothetical protein